MIAHSILLLQNVSSILSRVVAWATDKVNSLPSGVELLVLRFNIRDINVSINLRCI